MKLIASSLLALLLVTTALSTPAFSTRPGSEDLFSAELKRSKGSRGSSNKGESGGSGGSGGFFGSGPGFDIPGFGNGIIGGGYGSGYGGPSGGSSKGGIIRPTVVCKDKGPCFNKKLTCPAKCFTSYSRSGKGYGGGGGGGGCNMDCKKKCTATC